MIRPPQLSDAQYIRDRWDEYRATRLEYAREQGWSLARIQRLLANPRYRMLVDTDTKSLLIGILHPQSPPYTSVEVSLIFTLTTGLQAQRRAADAILAEGMDQAVQAGITQAWGEYVFPTDRLSTATAIRYFDAIPSCVRTDVVEGNGTRVRYDTPSADLRDFLRARL